MLLVTMGRAAQQVHAMGEQHSPNACAAWAAHAMAIASFILHLAGTNLIHMCQGRLSLLNR